MKPKKILMCRPDYFEVNYAGNEFMKSNLGKTDIEKALSQWSELKNVYEELGFEIELIEPVNGLPDMVFTANQSLPFVNRAGERKVVLSKMKNEQRKNEVKYFKDFFLKKEYQIFELPEHIKHFESMGDAVIDYERNILFGGSGFRTEKSTYDFIRQNSDFEIIELQLINPVLYHLDTCFSVLSKAAAVVARSAFDDESLSLISKIYNKIIFADEEENLKYFVCNCHCPDGKNVIVQRGSQRFSSEIRNAGFNLIEVETGEFMKSGGSVFCMKLMFY